MDTTLPVNCSGRVDGTRRLSLGRYCLGYVALYFVVVLFLAQWVYVKSNPYFVDSLFHWCCGNIWIRLRQWNMAEAGVKGSLPNHKKTQNSSNRVRNSWDVLCMTFSISFNSLAPKPLGGNYTGVFFKFIVQIYILRSFLKIGLRWMALIPIVGKSKLVQVIPA